MGVRSRYCHARAIREGVPEHANTGQVAPSRAIPQSQGERGMMAFDDWRVTDGGWRGTDGRLTVEGGA